MKVSVVMVAFDNEFRDRCITMTALNCLRRFTDTEDYELILVDTGGHNSSSVPYYRWEVVQPDKHIKTGDIGYSAAVNLGVEQAAPETKYLVLMHNDMFVQEGWLHGLMEPLEKGPWGVSYPEQIARPREVIKQMYRGEMTEGYEDAGLAMISKENYAKCGGFDNDFKTVHQQYVFEMRCELAGLKKYVSTKVFVTHIGGVTYRRSEEVFQKNREIEDALLKTKYKR